MANTSKGRFPSYGLVRGPSHSQGGVPASVANGPDVELEGGEFIIPKEAVPDYLPVLQQITQVGRDRQQMQNGNTAIDALIASASMQNGIAQPKSPVYQEGGRISNFFKKQKENFQRAAMMGKETGTRNPFLKTAQEQKELQSEYGLIPGADRIPPSSPQRPFIAMEQENYVPEMEGDIPIYGSKTEKAYQESLPELERLTGKYNRYLDSVRARAAGEQEGDVRRARSMYTPEEFNVEMEPNQRISPELDNEIFKMLHGMGKYENEFSPFEQLPAMPEDERGGFLDYLFGGRDNILTTRSLSEDLFGTKTGMQQGGMLQYEDGGEVHSRRMYNQGTGFDKKKSDLDGDGNISEYERKRGMAIAKSMGKMQEGGQVYADKKPIPYSAGRKDALYGSGKSAEQQRDIIAQRYIYPTDDDMIFRPSAGPASGIGALKGYGLNLLLNSLTGGATGSYNALAAGLGAVREIRKMGSDKTQVKRMAKGKQPFDPVHFAKDYESGDVYSATRKGWKKLDPETVSNIEENFPDYMDNLEAFNTGFKYKQEQGGPINNYQMGGMVGMQRPMNPAMNFSPMQRMNPRMYQEGGQVQPRKQFELRNPETFIGPPDSLIGRVYMNPFTGEFEDADAQDKRIEEQIKRLRQRMKQSEIPSSKERVPMQEGGQVNVNSRMGTTVSAKDLGLKNLGEVTSIPPQFNMSRPEFEAILNYGNRSQEEEISQEEQMANFMSLLENEKRVRPVSPDKYVVKDGVMSKAEIDVPKLTSAYMSSFGIATPLSRRQGAMLRRKLIAPETLNPQVKGLLNRVLVQRITNEEN